MLMSVSHLIQHAGLEQEFVIEQWTQATVGCFANAALPHAKVGRHMVSTTLDLWPRLAPKPSPQHVM